MKYLGDVNGQVEEVYAGQNIVKAFNKEEAVMATFEETNKKLYESGWKSQFFSGMMMPIMQFVGNIGYVMVALLGGFMTIKGAIEVGDISHFPVHRNYPAGTADRAGYKYDAVRSGSFRACF